MLHTKPSIRDIAEKCNILIPKSSEWAKAAGEAYGLYNCDNPEARVDRILFAVTATKEVAEYFREKKYDLLITHHPYKAANDIPQLIYHTALDCCKGGLNDMWADALGVKDKKHFDGNLGWYGNIEPIKFEDLMEKVEEFTGSKIEGTATSDKDIIESVCICSGLGGMVEQQAAKTKADCYIFGEGVGRVSSYDFPAVIETGHTASEWMGVHFFEDALSVYDVDIHSAPREVDYFGDEVSWSSKPTKEFKEQAGLRGVLVGQKGTDLTFAEKLTQKFNTQDARFDNPYADSEMPSLDELEDLDFGVTVHFKDGDVEYFDEFEKYYTEDEWFVVEVYDNSRGTTRLSKFFKDTVKKIEEDLI